MNPFNNSNQSLALANFKNFQSSLYVDPITKKIYKSVPFGWEEIGYEIPAGHEPPKVTPIPQGAIDFVRSAGPADPRAAAYASAISVHLTNAKENEQLFERFVGAMKVFNEVGQGSAPPPPGPGYHPVDFAFLLFHTLNGIEIPRGVEINYNQR